MRTSHLFNQLLRVVCLLFLLGFLACGKNTPLKEVEDVCTQMEDIYFMTYCYEHFDANKDGKVSMQEASAAQGIAIKANIVSFKGIEYFTQLKRLSISNFEIESLSLSHNTQLTELELIWNASLSSLDLSKNTLLKKVHLNHNNKLNHLDLSSSSHLETLYCISNTNLTSIITNSSELFIVNVQDNTLTLLDVSKSTVLDFLDCTRNRLTDLDISNNINLNTIYCGSQGKNPLTVYYDAQSQASLISKWGHHYLNEGVTWKPKN